MNNRFKFRAWDKNKKEMYENIVIVDNLSLRRGYFATDYLNKEITDNTIPMQYTGLKDKNGKEIYEGDILVDYRKNENDIDYRFPKIVFYDDMKAGFYIFGRHMLDEQFKNNNGHYRGEFINGPKKIIIGNIYETPNLLDNK